MTDMLKYMEEDAVYNQINFNYYVAPVKQYQDDPARDIVIDAYICPDWQYDRVFGSVTAGYEYELGAMCTYAGVAGVPPSKDTGAVSARQYEYDYVELADTVTFPTTVRFSSLRKRCRDFRKWSANVASSVKSPTAKAIRFMIGEFVHRDCRFENLPRAFSRKPKCSPVVYRQLCRRAVSREGG